MDRNPVDIKAVLAWLRAQRDRLDRAIAAVEEYEGQAGESTEAAPSGGLRFDSGRSNAQAQITHDTFVGYNIADASAAYLKMIGRPARSTAEITKALERGGLKVSEVSVGTILSRIHRDHGAIHRASRGMWGLTEWYPSRRSGTTVKKRVPTDEGSDATKNEKAGES